MAREQVNQLATGLRRTGETLQREGSEPFGRLASTAADSVERLGSYLDRTDVNGLMRDLSSMARRNPTVVFGAALAAGVMVGRFLRSSRPSNREVVFEPDSSLLDADAPLGSSASLGSYGNGSTLGSGTTLGAGSTLGSGSSLGSGTTLGSTKVGGDPPSGGWA